MNLVLGNSKDSVSATDLSGEIASLKSAGTDYEAYDVMSENEQGQLSKAGELLYVPSAGRAGIMLGGDSVWTDAGSAEDAIDRANNDAMVN